jgi:hypothetical protein
MSAQPTRQNVADQFVSGPSPYWVRQAVGPAEIATGQQQARLEIAHATTDQLADAEIGDYLNRSRSQLPWRPPLRMAVRARFSHSADELRGTSGFGFWNDPFDLAEGGVLAPPNTVWFFFASRASDMVPAPGLPGNGFRAEMINGGTAPRWSMAAGNLLLRVPGLTSLLYRAAQARVNANAIRLDGLEITVWHTYALHWSRTEALFSVDGCTVLRVSNPPSVPLGFVAWMDNQLAIARPDGDFCFGLESVPRRQWLALDRVEIEPL